MLKTVTNSINASQIQTPITLPGNVTLSTGNLVVGTSGKGVDFSANTGAAGMTSELLSDYEEGTWTGTLTSATPPTTPPTSTGKYTKIGRQVSVQIEFVNVNTSGGAGAMSVTGLPFAASASTAYSAVGAVAKYQLGAAVNAAVIASGTLTKMDIVEAANTTQSAIVAGTGRYLFVNLTYTV